MPQLKNGDLFPSLSAESVNHGRITVPDDIPAGDFAMIVVYRAHW